MSWVQAYVYGNLDKYNLVSYNGMHNIHTSIVGLVVELDVANNKYVRLDRGSIPRQCNFDFF